MAYFLKYNGIDLTDMVKVRSVEIPSLPSIEHSSIDMFERNGNVFNGASVNNREIKIVFLIYPTKADKVYIDYDLCVDDVKRAFNVKEEHKLYCGADNLYMWAVPTGDLIMTELSEGCCECEINLIAYDPYWYHTKTQCINNDDKKRFVVDNEGDVDVYPVVKVGFTKDTTFFQLQNITAGGQLLIGGVPSKTGNVIKKDTKILNDNMENTSGWVTTTAPIDSDRAMGGTISVTSKGTGLMAGDFGSATDGATWHGACYKKTLSTSVEDFKVKVRMSHNSSGRNGDPYHPYDNDTEPAISGTKSTYYKVTARVGLRLRKGASTSTAKLCTMPYGTKLTGSVSKGWLKTTYNGKTGYCYTGYLKKYVKDGTTTASQCNYVTNKGTPIRASASKKAKNKKTIPAGKVIRVITSTKYPTSGTDKGKFYKLAKKYEGVTGYVWIENLTKASNYEVEYEYEVDTADDKTGIVEIYGFSANNVQLFRMGMYDDNEYYEFTYPRIHKNGSNFLIDKTVAPNPEKHTDYEEGSKTVSYELSGKYGSWNEFYGELYIQRIDNKWYAYVTKIKDGEVVKKIKSKEVTDKDNKNEKLAYLVIYFGTSGDAEKASGMAINGIEVRTASKIDNTVEYNFQEFEAGDELVIDHSVPSVELNGVERNDLIDVGSRFFKIEPGENTLKIASDDTPNVDILFKKKYL